MDKINKLSLIVLALMSVLSFSNLFGINASSAAVPIGIVYFFIHKALRKQPMSGSGLDLGSIGANLRDRRIWLWLVLPIITDAVCVALAILFLPEYITFETARASSFVAVELSIASVLKFFIFALGEEIAWRAFFQNQLSKAIPVLPVLIFSSLLFALGHYKPGNPFVVIFGISFTFINSVLYGLIFYKTKNAWVSTIAHFTANIFEVALYGLVLLE